MAKARPRPDPAGYFGLYGGRFVPETLMAPLAELARAYDKARRQRGFKRQLAEVLADFVGRPTPLFFARRLTEELGGARIFLKREDLLHTGAHKINNAVGQCLLARSMGKERVIAETGAGQHGVATATAAASLGLSCVVYMGSEDMRRQRLNVDRMRLLGAEVAAVDSGSRTLKDAINESLRDWVTNVRTTHYVLGSVLGPDPYPRMVRDFHRVIGDEAKLQLNQQARTDAPDLAVACIGGGSNAIGLFTAFLDDPRVRLIGVEAGGGGAAWASTRRAFRAGCSGSSTAPAPWSSRTSRGRSPTPTRSPPASTTRRSAPSTSGCATPGGSSIRRPPTPRRSPASTCSPGPRASCPPWRAPMPSPRWSSGRRGCRASGSSWSTSPGAATRTSNRSSTTTVSRPRPLLEAAVRASKISTPRRHGGTPRSPEERDERDRRRLRPLCRGGEGRLHPLPDGRRPGSRNHRDPARRAGRRGRRPDRARGAVLRPDCRRSGQPAGRQPGARRRHQARRHPADRRPPPRPAGRADRPLHLLQPHPRPRCRALRRAGRRLRGGRGALRRPAARGGGERAHPGSAPARRRRHLPPRPDQHPRPGEPGRRRLHRFRLLCVAHRRHRRAAGAAGRAGA